MYMRLIILVVGGVMSGLLLQQPVLALGDKFTPGGSRRSVDLVTDDLQLFSDHPLQSVSAKAELASRVKQELGDFYNSQGRESYADAEDILKRAVNMKVTRAEAKDWNYAKNLLGRVLESQGKIEEAQKYDKLKI